MVLSFVGTVERTIDVRPSEFIGLRVPAVTETLLSILREIDPGVSYWEDDVAVKANELAYAAERESVDAGG